MGTSLLFTLQGQGCMTINILIFFGIMFWRGEGGWGLSIGREKGRSGGSKWFGGGREWKEHFNLRSIALLSRRRVEVHL